MKMNEEMKKMLNEVIEEQNKKLDNAKGQIIDLQAANAFAELMVICNEGWLLCQAEEGNTTKLIKTNDPVWANITITPQQEYLFKFDSCELPFIITAGKVYENGYLYLERDNHHLNLNILEAIL